MDWFDQQFPMPDTSRRDAIVLLFQQLLKRTPSPDEVYNWYKGNDSIADIQTKITASPEYFLNKNAPPNTHWDGDQGKYVPDTPADTTGSTGGGTTGGTGQYAGQSPQQIAQQFISSGKAGRGNLQPLVDALNQATGGGWQTWGEDGIANPSQGQYKDILAAGSNAFQWIDDSSSAGGGASSAGNTMSLGALTNAWTGGGFGSGVFNYPSFTPTGTTTIPPFVNPVQPVPAFTPSTQTIPPFTSPVGMVQPFAPTGVQNIAPFANPVQPIAPFQGPTGPYPAYQAPADFQAPTIEQARQSPGYQFALEQGSQALQRSAAAKGTLLTGGTLKALDQYGTGLADQTYQNVFNRALSGYQTNAQTGLNAYLANRDTNQEYWNNLLGAFNANVGATNTNFNTALGTYNANLNANQQNFGNQLGTYNANLNANQQNFGNALGAYNANINANQTNFSNQLGAYNANLNAQAQNFAQPLSTYQTNLAALQNNFANQLSAYNTNYATALGTHTTNFGDLYNLASLGLTA